MTLGFQPRHDSPHPPENDLVFDVMVSQLSFLSFILLCGFSLFLIVYKRTASLSSPVLEGVCGISVTRHLLSSNLLSVPHSHLPVTALFFPFLTVLSYDLPPVLFLSLSFFSILC